MKHLIFTLLLLAASPVNAETHEEIVDRAFASMELNLRDYWSYTETRQKDEILFVARFDPRLPEEQRWDLLSIDGREPTEDEQDEFREDKAGSHHDDSDDEDSGPRSMVAKGSLELIEETDSYWEFRFRPRTDSDDEDKFMKAVDGTLQVVKDGHYVAWIRMKNREPIKPGKGVKLEIFNTHLVFAPTYDGGPVLPRGVETRVKGKAMLVIKFDEKERVSYSDFERAIK